MEIKTPWDAWIVAKNYCNELNQINYHIVIYLHTKPKKYNIMGLPKKIKKQSGAKTIE